MKNFSELRDSGLLWYINRACLHPHGLALALHYDNDTGEGEPTGWSITEADDGIWSFTPEDDGVGKEKWRKFLTESDFPATVMNNRDLARG